jgi:flagellar FliL protein
MSGPARSPEEAAEDGDTPSSARGRKGWLLLIAPPAILAALLGTLWFTGLLPHWLGMHGEKLVAEKSPEPVFVELPEMVANLNGNPRRPSYVKLVAKVEVASSKDADRVRQAMPRLQDLFQTYLREMRPEELRGSAGIYRLREELIARADAAASPARISDVLFVQILVQ